MLQQSLTLSSAQVLLMDRERGSATAILQSFLAVFPDVPHRLAVRSSLKQYQKEKEPTHFRNPNMVILTLQIRQP
jgi:hypothetical protein